MPNETKVALTVDDALSILPDGDDVHTFRNPRVGMMLGADWDRTDIEAAVRDAGERTLTGGMARGIGHGLAILHGGTWLFVATDEDRLSALEARATGSER